MRFWALILGLLASLFESSLGADLIELTNGRTLNGTLTGRQSIYVSLSLRQGPSEIERRIKPSEIIRIQFSDSAERDEAIETYSASDPYQATPMLENLVWKRLPYLDLLSHEDELLFAMLLESYIQSGRPEDALDRAKLWRTKLRDSDVVDQIDELQILAAQTAGDLDEAVFYSRRWIDSGKSAHETALPWTTLAEEALATGRIEEALWLSLNPIVFTHPNSPRFLEKAYEIAVFSAFQLRDYGYAKQLYTEMRLRQLSWPIDSKRADILSKLERLPTDELPNRQTQATTQSASLYKIVGNP